MITTLTSAQVEQIQELHARFFQSGISTTTDQARAESAVAIIVAPALQNYTIHWVSTPEDGASLRASLRASLLDSLSDSLLDSLRDSLIDSLSDSLSDSLLDSLSDSLLDSLRDSLIDSLSDSLSDSLLDSLRASLLDSLSASLLDSLHASLLDSLRASLRALLRDSLLEVPWDCGLIAFYTFGASLVAISDTERSRIAAMAEFLDSAFALWLLPGHVIILGKPDSVIVRDGRLLDATWNPCLSK